MSFQICLVSFFCYVIIVPGYFAPAYFLNCYGMKKDMTAGTEGTTILLFAIPIMGANLLQVLYGFADSVIVGNFVNSSALGAIGLTGSMTWLLLTFCTGLGNGTSIAVSQFFGARKEKEIHEVVATSYLLSFVISLALTSACFLLSRVIIYDFLQTPEEMRADSRLYFLIYSGGLIFQMLYNVTYGILRAYGDSRGALLFLLISSLMNVGLDCLFRIVFQWGVAGAAAATVISQAASAAASILYMRKFFPEVFPKPRFLYAWKEKSRLLLRLSVPITFQQMVTALGFTVLQRLVNTFGAASIEGYAAMQKIEQIAHIPSNSFHTAIASFTGQNIGAGQTERVQKGYRVTVGFGVGISAALCVLVLIFDERLLAMFSIAGEAMKRGCEHLDLLMLFIWANTITNITCGFLQGAGDVRIPAASGFVNLGIRLALSYLFAAMGLGYICYFISMPPAWCLTSLFVYLRYRSGKWKKYRIV